MSVIRGSLTQAYQDGYKRRKEGGKNATLYVPLDPQGEWLYMNGVEDAGKEDNDNDMVQ